MVVWMCACWGNKSVNVMRTTSGALAFYLYHPQMQLATWSGIDLARRYSRKQILHLFPRILYLKKRLVRIIKL